MKSNLEPRINKKIIKQYVDKGRVLFPLCRDEEFGKVLPIKHQGKKPLHTNWTKKSYGFETLVEYISRGHNLGFRIGESDLIVDVDPKNGGDKSYKKLLEDIKIDDLGDVAPTVFTGSGGTHHYFKLPPDAPEKLRKNLKRYPGIDFLSIGSQAVIPGSYHYECENWYSWDDLSPLDLTPPELPAGLLGRLAYGPEVTKRVHDSEYVPDLTPKELKEVLEQIPVEEYNENSLWFEILTSSHYATGGEGFGVFLEWSLGDPKYSGSEDEIRTRWNSLRDDSGDTITTATLYKNLKLWGGMPPRPDALADFGEFLESGEVIDEIKKQKSNAPVSALRSKINEIDEDSNSKEINAILRECISLNNVQVDIVIRDLAKNSKLTKAALKSQLSDLRGLQDKKKPRTDETLGDADLRDLVQQVTAVLLREKYEGGRRLKYLDDGRFWFYDGKKWSPYFSGLIERDIYEAILTLRVEIPDAEFESSRVMAPVERILRAKTASELHIYDPQKGRPSVINLNNCELWINPADASLKKRKHSPESNLTYCLDIDLETGATCPVFHQTLREIFANEDFKDELIRHLWEILGYIIQPNKNIATWFLFLGTGANGKSLVLEIISELLGDAVLEQAIDEFAPGPGSQYAKMSLPGKLLIMDDDVSAKTILPDSFLKKVSENKYIVTQVKYGAPIRFRSTASVLLASNSIPGTKDVSYGMLRRASLIPFRRTFKRSERDYNRAKNIIAVELPGILVEALRGLKRLRKRGDFKIPRVCSDLRDVWRDDANPLSGFLAETVERESKHKVLASELWSLYDFWSTDNGIGSRYKLSRLNFYKSLTDMGFAKYRGTGGKIYFRGLKPVVISDDDGDEE